MTSEARRQAWLAHVKGPIKMDDLLPWGVIWSFERSGNKRNAYRLVLPRLTRTMECHSRPHHFDPGRIAIETPHLIALLRSRLTDEQFAKGIAAILTYSSQKVSS